MNIRHFFVSIAFIAFSTIGVFAQSYIFQFDSKNGAERFFNDQKNNFLDVELIGRSTNIYSVYPKAEIDINAFKKYNSLLHISESVEVETRDVPNDPQYGEQWPLPLIDAESAWNEVTHGSTYDGREIVIAVLDESFQIDHPDLINNIWTNEAEIPNDGIDNDNNGYIDDYFGLHVDNNTDDHPVGTHGTKVSGIIGAEGNNGVGISGINWKIKLMIISGANNSTDIIEGYNYALDQRKLYNETNGEQGAYVVATNLSAGIPNQFGTSYPAWCSMYDAMGAVGILSATAADNTSYDVDVLGDMPTTCQSEYLITVTSTDRFDQKAALAAYGLLNVDLGAPGADTYSTTTNSGYTGFTGTSSATPHVAGAIGILYAVNCPNLITKSIESPASAAIAVKQSILNSAVGISTLEGITVSGGRLNIFDALMELSDECDSVDGPMPREELSIFDFGPNPASDHIKFSYKFKDFNNHTVSIYNSIGQLIYKGSIQPSLFSAPTISLDVSELRPAMYLLTLEDDEDIISYKFFKE